MPFFCEELLTTFKLPICKVTKIYHDFFVTCKFDYEICGFNKYFFTILCQYNCNLF